MHLENKSGGQTMHEYVTFMRKWTYWFDLKGGGGGGGGGGQPQNGKKGGWSTIRGGG